MSAHNHHPTLYVALAHLQAQGVYETPEVMAALCPLFCPASSYDNESVERLVILAAELAQQALFAAQSGTPQTVTFAPDLAYFGRGIWDDVCKFLGVGERDD